MQSASLTVSPKHGDGGLFSGSKAKRDSCSSDVLSGVARRSLSSTGGLKAGGGSKDGRSKSSTTKRSSSQSAAASLMLKTSSSQFGFPSSPTSPRNFMLDALPVVLNLTVSSSIDVSVRPKMHGAKLLSERDALPKVCKAGSSASVKYVATSIVPGHEVKGALTIDECEPIPFTLASRARNSMSFVVSAGRWRYTALWAPRWNWLENEDKPSEGKAADLELTGGCLVVQVRMATAAELKRCLQLQALRDAEKIEDYDTLHAQVTKSKAAGVELEHIERAEELLKAKRKQGLHINVGCDKDTLRDLMSWEKVTDQIDATNDNRCCPHNDCPCNVIENCGEALEVVPNAVQEILGKDMDRELFHELVDSALGVEEGAVWRAGGKLIFSAFNRNQSVVALTRMLENYGKARCARLMFDLVKESEFKYGGFVTAVQINFHPNGTTFHDQHRDIYSGKQRAGPNCTCSFRECVGTVCYSLGSSRVCQLDTMTDETSVVQACGESCEGRREMRWLRSGEAMYFNAPWNQNHMHGIPKMEEHSGPRISIAFLLGAAQPSNTFELKY